MKKLITLLFLSASFINTRGQNVVQNPGFEHYTACPIFPSQFDQNHLVGWRRGTSGGTSDYFNACVPDDSTNPRQDIPRNMIGYQQAYEGQAYAGIFASNSDNYNWREYLAGNTMPLTVGNYYRVSMWVSLADSVSHASAGLGVFFYLNGIGAVTQTTNDIPVTPQIDYINYGILTDTANWVQLVDTFYADSAYTHLMIGNFRRDSLTPQLLVNDSMWQYPTQSYYYVDLIEVVSLTPEAVIETKHIQKSLAVPSAFSPNGDMENDILYIRGSGYKNVNLRIYNRLGQTVFETSDGSQGWDGTYKGQAQPEDQYGYVLLATFADGSTTQKTGSITLLR